MESQDHNSWKELAEQKEKEWKQFTQLRLESLETSCKQKDKNLNEEKKKFEKLKDDFKYNLKLLQERDQELERYDAVFTDYKTQLNTKNSELSESKILLDELRTGIRQEEKSREELQLHYQHRLKEKQQEIDAFRSNKDLEVSEERKHFEEFKRNLQEKLKEVEGELDAQKRELNTGFEEAMKKKEHEYRLKVDDMSAKVLEYELKAKLLSKELEFLRANQKQVTAEYNESEHTTRQLEKKLKEKEWEITDNKAMADAKINEMEIEMKQLESSLKRAEEDYQRKYSEMDKCLREREEALSKVKDSYIEREQTLTNTIRDLQTKLETAEIEIRQLQWTNTDLSKEKDIQTTKLKEELKELQDKWDKSIADMSRSQVSRDLEVHCLRENDSKLKAEILQKKQDIERYKKELTLAAEREAALERSKTQLELDWQNRYEDTERVQYEKSEDFIKKVIAARDEAMATVKENTRTLEEQERLLKIVERDRDIVMATLKKHGIPLDKSVVAHIESANSEDIKKIQEQNRNLRNVISQMRQQMESIGQSSVGQSSLPNSLVNADNDYIESLENEIKSLKEKMREIESKEERKPMSDIDKDTIPSEVKDNIIVRDHIVSLNEKIGILKSEKTELNAQCRKLQARLYYIETSSDKLSQEPRQKQIEIDQLHYQLITTKRRHEAETASYKQRLSELELQLIETRKEADEYYRGSLERNMEVTALGNQLSALKMEMAESRPAINLGAQELLIQQLQDEIMRLKQQEINIDNLNMVDNVNTSNGKSSTPVIQDLQSKLKKAVKHITTLAKEKQQLIEVGNRLRGELKKAGITSAAPNPTSSITNHHISTPVNPTVISHHSTSQQHFNSQRQHLNQDFINRLSQLEKLQYQLTKQELQYAQKFSPTKVNDVGQSDLRPILKDSSSTLAASKSREMTNTENSLDNKVLSSHDDPVLMSMSSVGGDSIQEVWKMLDGQGSPSLITPRAPQPSNKSGGIDKHNNNKIHIEGQKTALQTKDNKRPQSAATSKNIRLKPNKKPQARNYNVRDDRNR